MMISSVEALSISKTPAQQDEHPLRVLHVIGGLGPGGAETLLYRLVSRPSMVQHRVICLAEPDWYSDELNKRGIEVYHLNIRSLGSGLRGVARLALLVRKSGADVVQCWMYRSNFLAGLFARSVGIPVVWGIHCSSIEPMTRAARIWVYACGAVAGWVPTFVINCSNRSAKTHEELGFGRAPGKVVHNGYESEAFEPNAAAGAKFRGNLGIDSGIFLIGSIARWHTEKDNPNLLRALKILIERDTVDFRCILVGSEMDFSNPALLAAIQEAGCESHVIALGRRSDVADIMRTINLHVLPSRSEAFPNVVAEAMLCGTPCIVTDVGDAAYIVGETGWIAPPQDPEALAARIESAFMEYSQYPASWAARCVAARQRIVQNFPLDRMVEEYEEIWRSVA